METRHIIDFRLFLSDFHNSNKFVIKVVYTGNASIYYKPRPLHNELGIFRIIEKLFEKGELPTLKVITFDDYGWMEDANRLEIGRYSRTQVASQFGKLLGLSFLLDITDIHRENVSVDSRGVIILDAETIFTPLAIKREDGCNNSLHSSFAVNLIEQIPLGRTGLLPEVSRELVNDEFHISSGPSSWLFNFVDKDEDIIEHICAGYFKLIDICAKKCELNILENLIETCFPYPSSRIVFRDTYLYSRLLSYSLNAEFVGSAKSRMRELSILNSWKMDIEKGVKKRIVEHEKEALMELDIPYFSSSWQWSKDAAIFYCPSELKEVYFGHPRNILLSTLKNKLHLSKLPVEKLIRSRLELNVESHALSPDERLHNHPKSICVRDLSLKIMERAVFPTDEVGTFLSSELSENGLDKSTNLISKGIYMGSAGVALSLTALGRLYDNQEISNLSEKCFKSLAAQLRKYDDPVHRLKLFGSNFSDGLSGIGYAAISADRQRKLDAHSDIVSLCQSALVCADLESFAHTDFLNGSPGIAAFLILSAEITNSVASLDKAAEIARKIADTVSEHTFFTGHGLPVKYGMAHGLTGLAVVLYKIGVLCSERYLCRLSEELLSAEMSYIQTYLDGKSVSNKTKLRSSWCNGLVGSLIGRIEIIKNDPIPDIEEQSFCIAKNIIANDFEETDLCCGSSSALLALLEMQRLYSHLNLSQSIGELKKASCWHNKSGQEMLCTEDIDRISLFKGNAGKILARHYSAKFTLPLDVLTAS